MFAIPMAQDQSRSFFDDDLEEFELTDNQSDTKTEAIEAAKPTKEVAQAAQQKELEDEFAWVERR